MAPIFAIAANVIVLAIKIESGFVISGCRAGASPAGLEERQPERLPYKQNAITCALSERRVGREREGSAAR